MQPGNSENRQENKSAEQSTDTKKSQQENVAAAHDQAEADIEQDVDLNSAPDPAADLDEGEIARLDNDNDENPLI